MDNYDDVELILRAQKGEAVALEAIIMRYSWLVRSVVRKYFIASGTEDDLFQEGCMAIPKAIEKFDPEKNGNVAAYLSVCVDSDIKDALRASTRAKHKPLNDAVSLTTLSENTDAGLPAEYVYDPVHHFIEREGMENFFKNVRKLCSELHVKVLSLYMEGYPYSEIASMTGINEKKVDNIMMTVKRKIRENKDLFL